MADTLATPAELQAMPGLADLPTATATQLLEIATAVVQGEVGQILVAVENDPFEILGTTDSWFDLPQRPVTALASVEIDGEAVTEGTDFKRFGARLWRRCGWAPCPSEPSTVTGVYSHGYPPGARGLELAKSAALMLAASQASGPAGVESVKVDDGAITYQKMREVLENADHLRRSLNREYGRRAGLVRLG